jgi:hypothetical protein
MQHGPDGIDTWYQTVHAFHSSYYMENDETATIQIRDWKVNPQGCG